MFVALALATSASGRPARATEPVDTFLEAMWQRQLYDEALDYLDLLNTLAVLPENQQQKAFYQRGLTLVQIASRQSDLADRNTMLARAVQAFEKFEKDFPHHALAASAKNQIGNVLIERGRSEVQAAAQADNKEARLAAARQLYEQARQQFSAAETELDAQRQKLPKLIPVSDTELKARKLQVSNDLSEVRMLRASIDYELAKTFAAKSSDALKHLQAAAKSYARLYESNRVRNNTGLVARLWEGLCYQEMGETQRALGCYQELMDQPTTPETRVLKAKGTRHALECWIKDSEKKYQEAIERGERWEKESGSNPNDADALAIFYLTAVACQAQSDALPAKDPNRKKLAGSARQYIVPVASHPGEFQRQARTLLVALDAKKDKKDAESAAAAFVDAVERGKEALEEMQEATASLKEAEAGNDKKAIAVQQKKKDDATAKALASLELALALSNSKTSIEDLNSVRYYLCFLAWDAGRLYDAAVLGEFLARRYADSLPGRQGARIALAAYVRMYSESKSEDKTFEMGHIARIAELIFERWPGQEEADEAALTLLNFAAAEQQLDKIVEYLNKISPNSPRRGPAELRTGQALWSNYLRASQAPLADRPPQAKLDEMKKRAEDVLAQGIARMEKSPEVDAALAGAVFTMAQIQVENGQPEKAISWLENPKFGPLTLVKANHHAAKGFATETYKMALRAYIGVKPQELKKAEATMDALEKLAGKDAKATENLTAIYISMGRQLQQHLQELRKTGQKKELETVSNAFEVFLDRVTKRDTGGSYATLNWVGETYFSLGTGFDDGPGTTSAKAKTFFDKAATAYAKMLEIAEKDPKYKEQPAGLISVRLRLADCYCRAGKYDDSIKLVTSVLRIRPSLLTAQVQAAETYQAKGATDPASYALAKAGSTPGKDGQNLIWGWSKLSKQAASNYMKFADTFHLARLKMAEGRYQFALAKKSEPKLAKAVLEQAKKDLWYTYELHPDLGGNEAKYELLLKKIQKSLGEKEVGLAEFKQRDKETEKANTADTK
jgi:hypothetical protein